MTSDRTILITGVTGKQGGAVAQASAGRWVPSARSDAEAGWRAGGGAGAQRRRHRQGRSR